MNRKQLVLLLLAGVVLGGVGLYVSRQKSASFQRVAKIASEQRFGNFPVSDVAQIMIRHGTNAVNLVKTGGVWSVQERNQYPASGGDIIEFARKLWDLRPAQSQKIGSSQLGRLELLPPDAGTNSATRVELKGRDGKAIRTVLLGRLSLRGGGGDPSGGGGWPNGRWIYLPDRPGTAYLVSESFSEIEPRPERWLKKDFFRIEKPRSVAVDFPAATNSWKLTREMETGEWKLAGAGGGEQLDASKAAGVSNPLSSPSFTDVLPGDQLGGTGTNAPIVVKIETFDGFAYTVKVGQRTNDEYRMTVAVAAVIEKERTPGKEEKPEDKARLDREFKDRQQKLADKLKLEQACANWTYVVSSWTIEPLLKERSQLLAEKPEEPKIEYPPLPAIGTNRPQP